VFRSGLIVRLARREARAVALVPDTEVRTRAPAPQLLVEVQKCPWCAAGPAPDQPLPLRELWPVDADAAETPRLPVIAALRCELLTARSLLPLGLIRTRTEVPPRVVTRAVFWAGFAGWSAAPLPDDELWRGLRLLDRGETWLDGVLAALASGTRIAALPSSGPDLVLPLSGRIAADAADPVERVAHTLRSLHFLTPHATEPVIAELNRRYLYARREAVRAAFARSG
jgi:hypothetical protein